MAKSPGQSAMEYMLTYGWAVLVVMVVGIVMWQIGIFNLGGSTPTTSDGFAQLKPMLATCKMSEEPWVASYNGFHCMFTNPNQVPITITDVLITVDGEYCRLVGASTVPGWSTAGGSGMFKFCPSTSNCIALGACQNWAPGNYCVGNTLRIPASGTFFATTGSNGPGYPACWTIDPPDRYEAFIDITYDLSIGGKTVTKHSTGHIRGSHE